MSVINQMLQDLERRPHPSDVVQHTLNKLRMQAPEQWDVWLPTSVRILVLMLVVVSLSLLVVAIKQQTTVVEADISAVSEKAALVNVEPTNVSTDAPEIIAALFEPNVIDTTPIAKNINVTADRQYELTGLGRIRYGVQQDYIRLVVEFANANRAPLRRVETADGGLILWLDNVQLSNASEKAPPSNNILQAVNVKQVGDDVSMRLMPQQQPLEIRYHQRTEQTQYPYWLVVDVYNQPVADLAVNQAASDSQMMPNTPLSKPTEVINKTSSLNKTTVFLSAAEQADIRFEEAQRLLKLGQIKHAIAELIEVTRLLPSQHRAREQLIDLQFRMGDKRAALKELEQGLQAAPQHAAYAKLQAKHLLQEKSDKQALMVLQTAAMNARVDAEYLALMAMAHQRLGQHEKASQHYLNALSFNREQGSWWLGLGVSLQASGLSAEALEAFRESRKTEGLNQQQQGFVDGQIAALSLPVR